MYNQGEWLQEDPADALVTSSDVPYADTSTITFQRLRVNEDVPRLEFSDAQALSTTRGIDLAPTHVHDDAFSLAPAKGAALQYLVDAERLDSALYPVSVLLVEQPPGGRVVARSTVRTWSVACGRFAGDLQAQYWPSTDRAATLKLEQDVRHLQRALLESEQRSAPHRLRTGERLRRRESGNARRLESRPVSTGAPTCSVTGPRGAFVVSPSRRVVP